MKQWNTEIVRTEQLRNEKMINYARIIVGVTGFLLTATFSDQLGTEQKKIQFAVCGFIVMFGSGMLLLLKKIAILNILKFLSSITDILLLSLILWGPGGTYGHLGTFKGPEFVVFFLIIALAAYRFSIVATLLTGMISILAIVAMFIIAKLSGSIQIGTLTESMTTPSVSHMDLIVKLSVLLLFTMFLVAFSRSYGRVIDRTVAAEKEKQHQIQERDRVVDNFCRYVEKQVAELVLRGDVNLAGEKRDVTIMFCDIRDFTRLSEAQEPEAVVQFLNQFFAKMIDVIFKYRGTLDKFIGDGIMAVFGAPIDTGMNEELAIRAALEMRQELEAINSERIQGEPTIHFGIGIHSGEVIAGNIGSEKRLEYTVIGTPVNIASRIEGLNKRLKTDILISEATYLKVRNLIQVKKNRPEIVRGVREPVSTYQLEALHMGVASS